MRAALPEPFEKQGVVQYWIVMRFDRVRGMVREEVGPGEGPGFGMGRLPRAAGRGVEAHGAVRRMRDPTASSSVRSAKTPSFAPGSARRRPGAAAQRDCKVAAAVGLTAGKR